jgi:precorrin-3B synthase
VGFEFGQMQAETLSILAGIGPLRATPWRMILIEDAAQAPDLPGLITRPDDPMLKVIACTGAPACPQALVVTRPVARALCSSLAPGQMLHVSGCAKGCARPGPAALTLVGRPGGRFDLIRNGTTTDPPALTALAATALTPDILSE